MLSARRLSCTRSFSELYPCGFPENWFSRIAMILYRSQSICKWCKPETEAVSLVTGTLDDCTDWPESDSWPENKSSKIFMTLRHRIETNQVIPETLWKLRDRQNLSCTCSRRLVLSRLHIWWGVRCGILAKFQTFFETSDGRSINSATSGLFYLFS